MSVGAPRVGIESAASGVIRGKLTPLDGRDDMAGMPEHRDNDDAKAGARAPAGPRRRSAQRGRRAAAGVVLVAALLVGASACATEAGPSAAVRDGNGGGGGGRSGGGATTTTTAPLTTMTTAPPTTTTAVPPTTTTTVPGPEADGKLELGESGDAVLALQQRLSDLGYWLGEPDGTYGQLTRQAVMAFQKAEGLSRDGVAGPETQGRLPAAGRPTARSTSGNVLEIDLARQILIVVQGGQVRWVLNTSTGSGEAYASTSGGTAVATTPTGQFQIYRQIDGVREAPLGTLYRPMYFHGGIAIHGAGNVPAHPASHGCARVTNAAIDLLWSSGVAEVGTPVWVY
jgi:peptidoglycan hydrolase-like protein with peptidoglycan-binding domain